MWERLLLNNKATRTTFMGVASASLFTFNMYFSEGRNFIISFYPFKSLEINIPENKYIVQWNRTLTTNNTLEFSSKAPQKPKNATTSIIIPAAIAMFAIVI